MLGFHASPEKCDAGIYVFAATFVAILLVLAMIGTLCYFH